jgi:hypothetical protein
MKVSAEYKSACKLVLEACDCDVAFDDYAAMVRAFRAHTDYRIDGADRSETESRVFIGWTPFDEGSQHLVTMLLTASGAGLTVDQLADLFDIVQPISLLEALCVVEDAIVILDRVEAPAE